MTFVYQTEYFYILADYFLFQKEPSTTSKPKSYFLLFENTRDLKN